mgnify:CR=1 FL=1
MTICREIFEKKSHDYGLSWRILRPSSLTDQLFIKAQRIRRLREKITGIARQRIGDFLLRGVFQMRAGSVAADGDK